MLSILASAFTAVIISLIGVLASRKKDDAAANAITSGEWKRLYDEMCKRLEKLEAKFEVYQAYIQYLWMVVVKLTNQLEKAGIEPVIRPDRHFRGDDDDDFADIEWEWLDE